MTQKAVEMVAELMALSARTAPKGRGQDSIVIRVVSENELVELSKEMRRLGEARGIKFFLRDAGNLEKSDACLLLGCKAADSAGLDCGGCGYANCKEMKQAQNGFLEKEPEKSFHGPNCVIKMADLGIALGSAAKTASLHNVDNRVMFSAGVAALSLNWMEGCRVAFALPLKASGKSIYFDRPN
ncbi:MAG: DUF2148 domain-containing protein [Methanothrix sp.]|jgi:uncharacterized ferredoxin-like protein|nr:DUF2148 domain-containing protein [Methanothrix sp.]